MPNADQYRLMSIKNCGMDPKYLSIKINGNQCRSTWSMSINVRSIDLYWEVLKQFVRHWLKLIFFIGIRINCTILIGINQYWLALGIHWGSSAPCYKRCIMGWVLAVSASIEQADITLIFEWWFQNVLVKIFFSAMSLFASFLVLLLILVEAAPPTASSVPTLGIFNFVDFSGCCTPYCFIAPHIGYVSSILVLCFENMNKGSFNNSGQMGRGIRSPWHVF